MVKYFLRAITFVIVFLLIFSWFPLSRVQANSSDFTYILVNDEITITGGGIAVDRILVIPDMIDGYPVRFIGKEAFAYVTSFERVVLPEGVMEIADGAFMACKWLNKIVISSTVTSIGEKAFENCTYLHSIRFEGSAPQIASNAFSGVISSACFSYGNNWPERARQGYGGTIRWHGGHSYGSYAYGVGATCTEDGVLQQVCIVCDKVKQQPDVGSKLGHSFGQYVSDGNATCMYDGTKTAKCIRCDETDTVNDVGSMAHGDNNDDYLCDYCYDIIDHTCVDENADYYCDCCYQEYCEAGKYFPGDISGDGKVTMGDVAKLYAHIKGTSVLTDENGLDRCDISGDGKVTMGDVAKLYAHIKGTSKLY